MTARLLLFDIDHTLMRAGGAGFRTIDRLLEQRFGLEAATHGVVPDGKTDPLILEEIVHKHRLAEVGGESTLIDELRVLYEAELARELERAPAALMPGVEPLLETLAEAPDVLLGLLTGNYERTARVKLERFGLNHHFPFGAFGSDHGDRNRLPPLAVARAEAFAGRPIGLGRHVLIIGDTPLDVSCALVNGATAVGVATGNYSPTELREAGAHLVFRSLSETESAVEALLDGDD